MCFNLLVTTNCPFFVRTENKNNIFLVEDNECKRYTIVIVSERNYSLKQKLKEYI